ncbi:MAG: hypothetical protein COZ06_31680 [Armatimonadetes bacterium CG_4_10_14_3_um_filter_66_18]|nr:hypothetical protein [Armatimonadota bacterium]OIP11951.1 MAG: hypothetical protein AUJ96_01205 [Armatimonadetes bacterium CG2_30_66_41]PIU91011.1 MAG: hypothetical protein COS65_23355 [Armatimonadetes bacterium CG06_land_8_20_14_3_00_66_21]PIX36686.1 MAG: hypothetical protein COZ57_38185 [Armatimonadetes bacterium CG_4_8_14_3_um_filter_66_20]PIY38095.1 MAG: hypothetical protein COZ06_31680 [Armatimonadetes bacterium CG_4_10_14_3_um_filter_66_18]PIZ33294.1 MAG: hypothetical protein COY42_30
MNARQRFQATAAFEPVDRTYLLPPWLWGATLERWQREGLPADTDLVEHFGTDRMDGAPVHMQGPYGPHLLPPLARVVLEERDGYRIVRDEEGNGVHTIIVDSDGNNDVLIPLWLEAGVTGLRPFEVAASSDPVAARKEYGKDLLIQGGLDKRALARGKEAIDREVLSKVPWLCLQGGYFPQVDHLVPPDVSLEDYTHYAALLCAVAEDPERHLHEARRQGCWPD